MQKNSKLTEIKYTDGYTFLLPKVYQQGKGTQNLEKYM